MLSPLQDNRHWCPRCQEFCFRCSVVCGACGGRLVHFGTWVASLVKRRGR